MSYITFFTLAIALAMEGLLASGVSHTRLLSLSVRFEKSYQRLITCHYIHIFFLIVSRKPFQKCARHLNTRAFLLLREQMRDAHFLKFQTILQNVHYKCF